MSSVEWVQMEEEPQHLVVREHPIEYLAEAAVGDENGVALRAEVFPHKYR